MGEYLYQKWLDFYNRGRFHVWLFRIWIVCVITLLLILGGGHALR